MQKANKLHITNDLMNVILAISLFFYSAYYISGALSANLHTTVKYKRSAGFGAIQCLPTAMFHRSKIAQFLAVQPALRLYNVGCSFYFILINSFINELVIS